MTLATTVNRKTYTGNGVTTSFAFPYSVLAAADLKVYVGGTLKTLTTHYTLSGTAPYTAGCNVVFLTAPADEADIVFLRDPALTQQVDVVEGDPLPVESAVEQPFDRVTMIMQRLDDRLGRTIRQPDTDATQLDELPPAAERLSKLLGFDSDGQLGPVLPIDVEVLELSAADLPFTAEGEDAVSETVADVLGEQIRLASYGGVGDDSTDNSAALLAAVTAADVAGGGEVLMPRGTFRYSTGLTVPAGVSLIGTGRASTILEYTGSGVAITSEDIFGGEPYHNRSVLRGFTLRTPADEHASEVGPGTHGLRLANGAFVTLDDLEILGFDTTGLHFVSTSGKAVLDISISGCHIYANQNGLLATGVNAATNAISIKDSAIRANYEWNIRSGIDVRGWNLSGCNFEGAGAGALFFDFVYALSVTGCYFEQPTSGTFGIFLANSIRAGGVVIKGNFLQGPGDSTAITLGNPIGPATVFGADISGNIITGWSVGIDPKAVQACRIGPNDFAFCTTPNATPGGTCLGLVVHDSLGLKVYGGVVTELAWSGSAWV